MKSLQEKPQLSLQAYYGFNSDLVSPNDIKNYTIRQVFERGTSGDIGEIFRVYGQDDVTKVIRNADRLSLRAVQVAKTVLHISDNEFLFNRRASRLQGTNSKMARIISKKKAARRAAIQLGNKH